MGHPAESEQEINYETMTEHYVNFPISLDIPKSMVLEDIREATKADEVLTKVTQSMETVKWDASDLTVKLFHKCADQLTVNHTHDILLKNNKIVIPEMLQNQVIQIVHTGHQGIEKTKALLREKPSFTDMDLKVKEFISSYLPCQTVAQPNHPEPLKFTDTLEKPLSELSIDYYRPVLQTGLYLLVIIDN